MYKPSLYKGCLEPIVLQLLRTNDRMYGYEITQRVKEITNGELQITEGALYPLLHRLEAEGILTSEVQPADGRLRKYYSLTKEGLQHTKTQRGELQTFIKTLESLINPQSPGYAH